MEIDPAPVGSTEYNVGGYTTFDQNSIGEVIVSSNQLYENGWLANGKK